MSRKVEVEVLAGLSGSVEKPLSDLCGYVTTDLVSVLEAVGHRHNRIVYAHADALEDLFLHAFAERLAREADHAELEDAGPGFTRLHVNRDPDVERALSRNLVISKYRKQTDAPWGTRLQTSVRLRCSVASASGMVSEGTPFLMESLLLRYVHRCLTQI